MTSGSREVVWKNYCILPLQCKIKTIHEKSSSTGNLNAGPFHSMLTCYFVNLPHIRNGGFIPLPCSRKPVFCV